MTASKADIIARLQRDILPLQSFKTRDNNSALDEALGPIKNAFAGNSFPVRGTHEFISHTLEDVATTYGFITSILASLMQNGRACIWLGNTQTIFPPALKAFGIAPEKVIFIQLKKEKELLWAMEEALRCDGLAAVLGEVKELSFIASRRLQLAVEKSGVTGFVVRTNPRSISANACITRWKITALPGELEQGLPGVGFPRWNVSLLKVRNGKPGNWQIESRAGRLIHIYKTASIAALLKMKTG